MSFWRRLLQSTFIIRLRNWEYWPFGILQFPIFFYYPWLSFRAGSFTFFTGSNPGILMGGMFGESKYDVLSLIPSDLKPKTILFRKDRTPQDLAVALDEGGFTFPLIFKPDIGERGFMVRRINNMDEAICYLEEIKHDFIIQELVKLPLEFGVFYVRYPADEKGSVTSIVMKEMLQVSGDGKSTLRELILQKDRAKLQWKKLQNKFQGKLNDVIAPGEKIEIVSIGNHCLGTKFINANHLINDKLNESFNRISGAIPGFFFGRFDLRCNSIQDLENGRIQIMELNGCGAEPAHIYDPDFSFFRAVSVLINHWRTIFQISEQNKKAGTKYLSFREAMHHYHNFREKTK
jgi:hypothetical protein